MKPQNLNDIIHSIEFYPNGDIRTITLNRHLKTSEDYRQYDKEFEIKQREFYDKRNGNAKTN